MFGPNTVDGILGSLAKLESQLATLADKQRGHAASKRSAAADLQRAADGHAAEADRANRVAKKVRDLVA